MQKYPLCLAERPALRDCRTEPGAFVPYKGRAYCWLPVSGEGVIALLTELPGNDILQQGYFMQKYPL